MSIKSNDCYKKHETNDNFHDRHSLGDDDIWDKHDKKDKNDKHDDCDKHDKCDNCEVKVKIDLCEICKHCNKHGPQGPQGPRGPQGVQGPQGEQGSQGPQSAGGLTIYLASFPVPNNQFVGLGTASNSFIRNTVVIPVNATITGMVLNIRDEPLSDNPLQTVSAEIIRSTDCGTTVSGTGIIATVTGPNSPTTPNCCASTTANFDVNKCDLLSVQITRTNSNAALQDGVAVTILLSIR